MPQLPIVSVGDSAGVVLSAEMLEALGLRIGDAVDVTLSDRQLSLQSVEDATRRQLAALTAQERAELAHLLILSLDQEGDADAEAAWDAELRRRAAEIKSGDAVGRPAGQVFAELRERYS
jgi:putative addiction module component (TIGR02574 family)